jgi:hypothetical protein
MKECHSWRAVFTGQAVAALPGQELVTVAIVPPEIEDLGHRVWREQVQAWGVFRQTLILQSAHRRRAAGPVAIPEGYRAEECPACGERQDEFDEPELLPMVYDPNEHKLVERADGSANTALVGLYAVGVEPSPEDIAEAVDEAREKMAKAGTP